MRKLFLRIVLIGLPIIILISSFLLFDPFKIIWKYKDYSQNYICIPNRDYVSTEVYKNNREKYKYNSFIFGSSRTMAYKTNDWKKHLGKNASPIVFDASGESLFGIYKKIQFIDKMGDTIKNALIILCSDCSLAVEGDNWGHLYMKHPGVAGTSWINFYEEFFKTYLDWKFLKNYYQFLLTHKFTNSMFGYLEYRKITFDTVTNDLCVVDWENGLTNPDQYYNSLNYLFYKREDSIPMWNSRISGNLKNMLIEIHQIFVKHHTNYKIVISPLYDQKKFNNLDFQLLGQIFGNENVFDFSGKNGITNNIRNYYEISHYRPIVGDSIMNVIYKTE